MTRECGVCGWTSREGVELPGWCPRCRGTCIADVADLPELYRTLAAVMEPGAAGDDIRVGGSRTPPLPFRLDPANLRGPATAGAVATTGAHRLDQHGALSIATVLAVTRQVIRDACDLPAEYTRQHRQATGPQIEADAKFVMTWIDRYAERVSPDELGGVVESLRSTRRRAWAACGYTAHRIRLGPCPTDYRNGQTCGEELWIDPVLADSVTCRACGVRWDRRYFLWLRRMAGPDEGTAFA